MVTAVETDKAIRVDRRKPETAFEVINRMLSAEDKIAELEKVCSQIPYFLSHEEAWSLRKGMDWGDNRTRRECEEELIYHSLPTLLSAINCYRGFGFGVEDLFESGIETLLKAIRNWDPNRKQKNSSKPFYLRQHVGLTLDRQFKRKILQMHGLNRYDDFPLIRLYLGCFREFVDQNDRRPSLEEITQLVKEKNVADIPLFKRVGGRRVSRIKLIYSWPEEVPITEGLEGQEQSLIMEEVLNRTERDQLSEVLKESSLGTLTPRERKVIELRFGLEDGRSRTLEEIGRQFNVTRERIRQIEAKALKKSSKRQGLSQKGEIPATFPGPSRIRGKQ